MRTSVPIGFILLPTVLSLGLLLYGILSDRWVKTNFNKVEHVDRKDVPPGLALTVRRIPFLKRLGLFSKCIDYRWLNIVDLNTTAGIGQLPDSMCSRPCRPNETRCGPCCIPAKYRCDNIPECETLDDELGCPRLFDDDVWLDEKHMCFRHKINVLNLTSERKGPRGRRHKGRSNQWPRATTAAYDHSSAFTSGHLLHGIMVWLLVSAAATQILIVISLTLVELCQKHLSCPFSLLTTLCLLGFLCGASAIGIFLWNWVHRKIHMTSFHHYSGPDDMLWAYPVTYRLNPWLTSVEILDVAFYVTCAGVALCLITTIVSLLFFCGAASSRFSFDQHKGSYEIVKILPYDDHYVKS